MSLKKLKEERDRLMTEYEQQQKQSPLKGNPYIVGLHAMAQGIDKCLPMASEMLELLQQAQYHLSNNGFAGTKLVQDMTATIKKARGE